MSDMIVVERIPSLFLVVRSALIAPSVDCVHYTVMAGGLTSGAGHLLTRIAAHLLLSTPTT